MSIVVEVFAAIEAKCINVKRQEFAFNFSKLSLT